MTKYILQRAECDAKWDERVQASEQGTIFTWSDHLAALQRPVHLYYVCKGQVVCGWVVCPVSPNEKSVMLDPYLIYGGIGFVQEPQRNAARVFHERFDILEFIATELDARYENVELALSPQVADLRPFLWHNYHAPNGSKRYTLDLRYTSYLNIQELAQGANEEKTHLFLNLNKVRQQSVRKATLDGVETRMGEDTQAFMSHYESLMIAQESPLDEQELHRMHHLVDALIRAGRATLFITETSGGVPIYATVFCYDSKRAYYLFGAGPGSATQPYRGTIALWQAMRWLAQNKAVTMVDLEGVNSPDRGRFKTSFGGVLMPYYEISL